LTASPGLWSSITKALDSSEHFVLLASADTLIGEGEEIASEIPLCAVKTREVGLGGDHGGPAC